MDNKYVLKQTKDPFTYLLYDEKEERILIKGDIYAILDYVRANGGGTIFIPLDPHLPHLRTIDGKGANATIFVGSTINVRGYDVMINLTDKKDDRFDSLVKGVVGFLLGGDNGRQGNTT